MPEQSEQIPDAVSNRDLGLFMLDFLRRTSVLEREYRSNLQNGAVTPKDVLIMRLELGYTPGEIIDKSRTTINDCLTAIGGIHYMWTERSSGSRIPCRLLGWDGVDQEEPDLHLWRAEFAPPRGLGQITVAATRLDEIESHFLMQQSGSSHSITPGALQSPTQQLSPAPPGLVNRAAGLL